MAGLIVADKWGKAQPATFANQSTTHDFKKGPPPSQMGEKFGNWAGRDLSFISLPGGAVLQFDLSRLTLNDYRGMRDHYQVNICLAMLMFLMWQLDWKIESTNQKQATQIEDNLKELWPEFVRGYSQSHWAGYSPMAVEVDNNPQTSAIEISKIKDLLPEECFVNWKTIEGYALPGHSKPKIRVFDGINQFGVPTIPVDNACWSTLLRESGDYYGRKLLRSAFPSWFFSILVHLYSNRYFERFGEPVPIGRAPFDEVIEGPNGQVQSGRAAMESILTSLRNRSVVVLPNDRQPKEMGGDFEWSISFLESQMRGADFEHYLSRLDEEISLAMFTPLLVTRTSDVGSYNLGVGHLQMYLWMLNALASDFKEDIDRIINRLKVWNYGPNAPKCKFVFRSMGKENVEILKGMVDQSIRRGDIKPDVTELGKAVGMTFEDTSALWQPVKVADVNTGADPNQPQQDDRTSRGRGSSTPQTSGGVGSQRPTGRKVAASVAEGVVRAFEQGTFGPGFAVHIAPIDGSLERNLEAWVSDVADLGPTAFEGPQDFLSRLESVADQGLSDLGAG